MNNRLPRPKSRSARSWRSLVISLLLSFVAAQAIALPSGFVQDTVLSNLNEPVNLQLLPDGRFLVLEKAGTIRIFDPTVLPAQVSTYMTLPDVESVRERGLASMALDPNFASNGYIYIYYTNGTAARNRISRFEHQGNTANPNSEFVVWQDNENWSDCCHYGGGLGFGPDGKLYLTTGEEFDGTQAQDLDRAGGKIIRVNKDGSIPTDNPWYNAGNGLTVRDTIWARGLRNPYRAHWDLIENRFFIGDVGGNVQSTAREEFNYGEAGKNYGWPNCEGACSGYKDPFYDYGHTTATPAGGAATAGFVYRGSQFPSSYAGAFFYADYALSYVKYLKLNANGSVQSVNSFATNVGRPVALAQGPDGAMYVVDYYYERILRFSYNSGNQAPVIQSMDISPTAGGPPRKYDFSATASDAENDPLTYHWFFGDGADGYGQTVQHTYGANGSYNVTLEVSDGTQSTFSAPQTLQVGSAPTATIDAPVGGSLFRAGDTIAFSGSASDPDETIPATNYEWDVKFIHNAHEHPTLSGYQGTSGQFEINTSGHDYHDDTGYRITLTVTDSDSLEGSDTIEIYPDKVDITFSTSPAGIPVSLDGVQQASPFTYDTMIGFQHVLSVPASHCIAGQQYDFVNWSDGGLATHTITVPGTGELLRANYAQSGPCTVTVPTNGLVLHLEADVGVTVTGGDRVTGWGDQSDEDNHVGASGDPRLVPNALNGNPVIDFDGSGDSLQKYSGLSGLPSGNSDRTVYLVTNYHSGGFGGLAYGKPSCNQAFGAVAAINGDLTVQGYCSENDFNSGVSGVGAGWMIQSAVLQSGQASHYLDGSLIDTQAHTFNTVVDQLKIGAELNNLWYLDMEVAAALIYDRALSIGDQQQVQNYLQSKYFQAGGSNQPPVAVDEAASVANGSSVVINVLANDYDPDGSLLQGTVQVVNGPAHGTTAVNPSTGAVTYTHDGSSTTSDSFIYQVYDNGGLSSNAALVTLSITGSGGGNTAPVLGSIGDRTVVEGSSQTINIQASDADSFDSLSFSVSNLPMLANGSIFFTDNSDGTAQISVNPSPGDATSSFVTVTVSDNGSPNLSDDETFLLQIVPAGSGPFAQSGGVLSMEAEHFTDNVAAGGAGQWSLLDPAAANASNAQAIKAADGPVTETAGAGSYTSYEAQLESGTQYVWARFRSFSSGTDSFFFQFDGGPIHRQSLGPDDGQWRWVKLTNSITVGAPGVYGMKIYRREKKVELDKLVVSTNSGLDPSSINGGLGPDESARVAGGNAAPVLDTIGLQPVDEGASLLLDITASDPNGDPMTLVADPATLFGQSPMDLGGGTWQWTLNPPPGSAGDYPVTITVADNGAPQLSDEETFTVRVTDPAATGAFIQDGTTGMLVAEAENFTTNVAAGGKDAWLLLDPASPNTSNAKAIKASTGGSTAVAGAGPYTEYFGQFSATGPMEVWVRFRSFSSGEDSFFFQFDGGTIKAQGVNPDDGEWHWLRLGGSPITVNASGTFPFRIYRRERNTEIDKIILTPDAGYTPTGTGPAESPRAGGT